VVKSAFQVEVIYTGEHGGGYQAPQTGYCAATAAAAAQQSGAASAFSIELSHAAQSRLDHLRREAETGQLSVTSFIRRACKVKILYFFCSKKYFSNSQFFQPRLTRPDKVTNYLST